MSSVSYRPLLCQTWLMMKCLLSGLSLEITCSSCMSESAFWSERSWLFLSPYHQACRSHILYLMRQRHWTSRKYCYQALSLASLWYHLGSIKSFYHTIHQPKRRLYCPHPSYWHGIWRLFWTSFHFRPTFASKFFSAGSWMKFPGKNNQVHYTSLSITYWRY